MHTSLPAPAEQHARPCSLLLIGGTFDTEGGRSSGYFHKLATALQQRFPERSFRILNGGFYSALEAELSGLTHVGVLLWFADIPNELPKLLPQLRVRNPSMTLVSSKNNRQQAYSREQLFARMAASQSHFLVEFTEQGGQLVGSLLAAPDALLLDKCPDIPTLAHVMAEELF